MDLRYLQPASTDCIGCVSLHAFKSQYLCYLLEMGARNWTINQARVSTGLDNRKELNCSFFLGSNQKRTNVTPGATLSGRLFMVELAPS